VPDRGAAVTERRATPARSDRARSRRAGRRLALAAVFEAEFGQRTPRAILERHLAEVEGDPGTAALARAIVDAVVAERESIDIAIAGAAPQYPVVSLARMDRALLRCALGEVLHSGTTPARVAIAEWVELARIYSGDPMRRLMNGVLGKIASESPGAPARRDTSRPAGPSGS
jgi:N utilization substance protein B